MVRQYRNPPIKEAICDIRFEAASDWDIFSPVRILELLRDEYDGKPSQNFPGSLEVLPEQSIRVQQGEPLTQLTDIGEKSILRFSDKSLTVHILEPYPGWTEFRRKIIRALDAYAKIVHPGLVRRIGVRYVNHISPPGPIIEMSEYFTNAPDLPNSLDLTIGGFLLRIDAYSLAKKIRLTETFAIAPTEKQAALVLDLDVSRDFSDSERIKDSEALAHIDVLRDFEREAFESLITEKSRALFDVDNNV